MFSSAFKSFTSNITSNYEISKQSTASAGAWQVFDAKKKSTGSQASIFIFDRKSLDVQSSGLNARASSTSIRKIQDEVVDRLKREASSLARLRHPSILQLVEPVEDTRSGGLMFATEAVIASLSNALSEKNDQERSAGVGGRPSKYVVEEADGTKRRRDLDMDELEIQKGLLQVAKGLEFLHDSAKLVHGNLTPDAIFVNAKSDWKISGLAFAGPPNGLEGHQAVPQISLSELLHHDPRIPRSVQLNMDYTSPDFVLDQNLNISADIFSLGLMIVALYTYPHKSPIETHGNQSSYKKAFSNSSTTPSPGNDFLSSRPLPRELAQTLPRLLARRPVQRLTAREFQQSEYFDNVLINTIRFLDDLPAKTPNEKAQFMRGLAHVMPQFPASVLGKKVLIALLDELKDKELLALVLQNIFKIIQTVPAGRRVFPEKVLPRLRDIFLTKSKIDERDTSKEAGLMVVLENMQLISENCSGKEFKDDVLPIIQLGMESPTHAIIDASFQSIPAILPILDFSTVKHDLFPVVAAVFSKTSSLSIKVRGLEALSTLCGASASGSAPTADDLTGVVEKEKPNKTVSSLDKFTMQEGVVPLLKGIKTKEPAVMMAALKVFQQIGKVADTDFLAMDVMPILWSFSLGPLLNLSQFKSYVDLIKSLSSKIEREQVRKLQDLSSTSQSSEIKAASSFPASMNGSHGASTATVNEDDFERLVLGNRAQKIDEVPEALANAQKLTPNLPTFSWSSTNTTTTPQTSSTSISALRPQPVSRSITPDVTMSSFPTLQPALTSSASMWNTPQLTSSVSQSNLRPLQPLTNMSNFSPPQQPANGSIWQSQPQSSTSSAFPPTLASPLSSPNIIWQSQSPAPAFTPGLLPPPTSRTTPQPNIWQSGAQAGGFNGAQAFNSSTPTLIPQQSQHAGQNQGQQKSGLDKYQSLL